MRTLRRRATQDLTNPGLGSTIIATMKRAISTGRTRIGFGLAIGLMITLGIVVPGLTQEAPKESDDPGREMALAAGCDMSESEVSMEVSTLDYIRGAGAATVEEAVLGAAAYLKQNGVSVSDETLRQAAQEAAAKDIVPVEVPLPGASLLVVRNGDAFVLGELIACV
jgi:hypothetical protein